MRITTYKKRMDSVLKHRPRFESKSVSATVTLTGGENTPVIDMNLNDNMITLGIDEAKLLATWIKQVAR